MPYSLVMPAGTALLLTIHLAATAAMAGLIWFVQINHYPLFDLIGADHFVDYEHSHQRLTSWVVGPFMAIEGVTALLITAIERNTVGTTLAVEGLVLLAMIHASTVFLQVPAHTRLSAGHDRAVVRRLVLTNWIRTIGWSARTVVAGAMIVAAST